MLVTEWISLQVYSLWLQNDLASFFCPSLLYRCSGCICQRGFFSIFIVAWRFSTLSPVALMCILQDTHFCVRGLGFYGLISGCVNCSYQRWWWLGRRRRQPGEGAFLTDWVKPPRLKLWSFIPPSAGWCWRTMALGLVPSSYSSVSLQCVLF